MYPLYYKYPGDGYNNWKVIVEESEGTFVGTTRVYPSGLVLDGVYAGAFYRADPSWERLTLEQAVELTKQGV